jgi:hypothetical protein
MPIWEYFAIHLSDLPRGADELDLLNDAGEEGWELVTITTNHVAYLKRRREVEPVAKALQKKAGAVTLPLAAPTASRRASLGIGSRPSSTRFSP